MSSDIVEQLREWTPSQCWSCGEWGCTNAAGHDIYCMGTCACETDCECVCSTCGSDMECVCECHLNYSDAAAAEIERLRAAGEELVEALHDARRRHQCDCADGYDERTGTIAIAQWEAARRSDAHVGE